jgi:uncharacterized protein (UPF0333 family)
MKSQAAFEYILIFSIVLLMVLILTAYSGEITTRNREDIRVSNTITAVNKIVEAANIVSTQGKPSQITLSIYIPEEIESINITGKTILMKVRIAAGITDIFATSKSDLQGNISNTAGTKNIKILAEGNYVNITEG